MVVWRKWPVDAQKINLNGSFISKSGHLGPPAIALMCCYCENTKLEYSNQEEEQVPTIDNQEATQYKNHTRESTWLGKYLRPWTRELTISILLLKYRITSYTNVHNHIILNLKTLWYNYQNTLTLEPVK